VLWAQDHGFQADARQAEFLRCREPSIILNWCRQSGKTTSAAIKAAHAARYPDAFFAHFPPAYKAKPFQALIISATQRQAGILQKQVLSQLQKLETGVWRPTRTPRGKVSGVADGDIGTSEAKLVRQSVLSLELGNGSEVVSVPASPDTVRGYSPNLIIMDEASRIRRDTWDAINPMGAAKPMQLILLSTPAGRRGFFYEEWFREEFWWKSEQDASMCPRITEEWLERQKVLLSSENMFRQEYFLEFVEVAGSLFSAGQIEDMFAGFEEEKGTPWEAEMVVEGEAYGTCVLCGGYHGMKDCRAFRDSEEGFRGFEETFRGSEGV